MKRKIILVFTLIILLTVAAISFTACGEKECNHTYEITRTKEATCTEKGYTSYECTICADTYNDNYVEAKGHTETVDAGKAATCTQTGLTEGKHCSVCNTVLVEQNAVEKTQHNYSEEMKSNATHHYYECECGEKKGEAYHISSGVATLIADEVCTVCGYTIKSLKSELENFVFTATDTTCEITGIKDKTVKNIVVPNIVTSIAFGAFDGCDSLQRITLPFLGNTKDGTENTHFGYIFGAESADDNGEYVPRSLMSAELTGGSIGDNAFAHCNSLVSVTIPLSAKSIGENAFLGCDRIFEVINHSALEITKTSYNLNAIEVHKDPSKVINLSDYLFYTYGKVNYLVGYAGASTELVLPERYINGNYQIYSRAFYNDEFIESVTVSSGVTQIGEKAFYYCKNLSALNFSGQSNLEKIAVSAFQGCQNMENIAIPASVTSIGGSVFRECASLKTVTFADGSQVKSLAASVFNGCESLESITLPAALTTISSYAFRGCKNLTSINIPASVTGIGYQAFYSCSKLTTVNLGNTSGWTANGTAIPESDLATPATAATHLKSTYVNYSWTRGQ